MGRGGKICTPLVSHLPPLYGLRNASEDLLGYFCPSPEKVKARIGDNSGPPLWPSSSLAPRRKRRAGSLLSAHGLTTSVTLALRPPLTAHIPLPESTCGYQAPSAACCTEDLRDQGDDPLRAGTLTFSRGWAQITD